MEMNNNSAYPNQRWKKWVDYLNILSNETNYLSKKRAIWKEYDKFVNENNLEDKYREIHKWIVLNFIDSILIGIRRMLDEHSDTISLVNFLSELKHDYALINIDKILTYHENSEAVTKAFKRFSSDDRNMDLDVIESDISKLTKDYDKVIRIINDNKAHKRSPNASNRIQGYLSYEDIGNCMNDVEEIFDSYYFLIANRSRNFMITHYGFNKLYNSTFSD